MESTHNEEVAKLLLNLGNRFKNLEEHYDAITRYYTPTNDYSRTSIPNKSRRSSHGTARGLSPR